MRNVMCDDEVYVTGFNENQNITDTFQCYQMFLQKHKTSNVQH